MNYAVMFSRLLGNTTNSYKYLFLNSIIERIIQGEELISIDELIIDMLVFAWYPSQYFKLSFGLQDQVGNVFEEQSFIYNSSIPITSASFTNQLRLEIIKYIDIRAIRKKLADYVQYRLLTPFFSEELRGKKDQVKNGLIWDLADSHFKVNLPLYKITQDKKSIVVNLSWRNFIKANSSILRHYQKLEWISYLQKNNPNIPAIIYKTEPPIQRSSLAKTQKYWEKFVQENTDEKCIYTGKHLITLKPSIDHFLPWSFVCHDRLWNLIPVCPISNSSKGNNLPSLDKYLSPFMEQQFKALSFTKIHQKDWKQFAAPLVQDLGFSDLNEVFNEVRFEMRLRQAIQNQYSLANQLGFSSGWILQN